MGSCEHLGGSKERDDCHGRVTRSRNALEEPETEPVRNSTRMCRAHNKLPRPRENLNRRTAGVTLVATTVSESGRPGPAAGPITSITDHEKKKVFTAIAAGCLSNQNKNNATVQ